MKCPSCGAEIGTNKTCDYCGATITADMLKEQEQLNKKGCPKCGSSNIEFKRENQGEIRSKSAKKIVHTTVGYCKDCGYTWYPQGEAPKKRKTWLWVLGWLFIFPVPLTILLLRKKDMKPVLKYGIIAVAWIVYLAIGFSGNSNKDTEQAKNQTTETEVVETATETKAEATTEEQSSETHIYDSAEVLDLMNGAGTAAVGTITVTHAKQSECTDEALSDWYANYVLKHSDSNYHIIVYDDVADKGVYSNGKGFIQKDTALNKEKDGTYYLGDDAGSTYYTVNADNSLTVQASLADESVVNNIVSKVDAIIPEEYKAGKLYSVDVAGEEGNMDCNLTLICEDFASADCQKIAEDLAAQVKDLDLGIGYFCIAFQKDDYTLTAISSLDDLNTQEAKEITTKTF